MGISKCIGFLSILIVLPFSGLSQDTLQLSRKQAESIFLKENLQLLAEKLQIDQAEAIILIVALFPIFSFQKVEGKMFSPLAFTLGYALLGSLILSITFVPALCKVMLRKNIVERGNSISRFFNENLYRLRT